MRRDTAAPGLSFAVSAVPPSATVPPPLCRGTSTGMAGSISRSRRTVTGSVAWMTNNGAGGFSAPMPLADGRAAARALGHRHERRRLVRRAGPGLGDGSATLFRNDGTGGFSPQSWTTPGHAPYAAATGDFNGDGHVDFAILDAASGALRLILGGSAVGVGETAAVPSLGLLRAWPNPFQGGLNLRLGCRRVGDGQPGGLRRGRPHRLPAARGSLERRGRTRSAGTAGTPGAVTWPRACTSCASTLAGGPGRTRSSVSSSPPPGARVAGVGRVRSTELDIRVTPPRDHERKLRWIHLLASLRPG